MMEVKKILKVVRSVKHVPTSSKISKLIKEGSNSKVLIISDNFNNSFIMEVKFTDANWSANSIGVQSMMAQNIEAFSNQKCIVLFVDADFSKRFSETFHEISTRVRNVSKSTSIYLLFEGEYDPCYASWLGYIKRVFQSTGHRPVLRKVIREIILQESE
jgi:hypothetical protein